MLEVFDLGDGSQIRLATSRWLTPDGEQIFGKGITPDEVVPLGVDDIPVDPDAFSGGADPAAALDAARKDPQLVKALELLDVAVAASNGPVPG